MLRPPRHATVAAYLSLFIALGTGGAYAANTIGSADVIDGSLRSEDIKNNSLTGEDINESRLVASKMGCDIGLVHGFARVHAEAGIPKFFTSSREAINTKYNCSGGAVEVRRRSEGFFIVRFRGNPAVLATAVSNFDRGRDFSEPSIYEQGHRIAVARRTTGADAGAFEIRVGSRGDFRDKDFTVMLF